MRRISTALLVVTLCAWSNPAPGGELVTAVVTDADAFVEVNTWGGASIDNNFGSSIELKRGNGDWNRKCYVNFDLGELRGGLPVTSASLRIEWKNTEFGPGLTSIFAIMDEAKDWDTADLPETGQDSITYANAPQCGPQDQWDFSEEGPDADAVTRAVGTSPTLDPGVPAPVDVDATALVQWLMGSNPDYSNFLDTDRKITICFREGAYWNYANYYSKENTPADAGDAPRLVITQEVHDGDANYDNAVNYIDLGIVATNYDLTGMTWGHGDFTGEGAVDYIDLGILATEYDWVGPSPGPAVPEPVGLCLLAAGWLALVRRRR